MFRTRAVALIAMAAIEAAAGAHATPRATEATAGFCVMLQPSDRTDAAGYWTLGVTALSFRHGESVPATLRIEIGPGARIIEGEAVRRVFPAKGPHFRLKLLRTQGGPLRIRGSLRVPDDNPSTYDYSETELQLRFVDDSVAVRSNRLIQEVTVRDGRRFRYGGEYLVAIEDDEVEAPRQFLSRAAVVRSEDIVCRGCGEPDTVIVPMVVTVGRGGNVTWVRPGRVDGKPVDAKMWAAITEGVRHWGFSAARSPDGPVADWVELRVRVVMVP